MSYKTFLGAALPSGSTPSYDGSGVIQPSNASFTPDNVPPAESVNTNPSGGEVITDPADFGGKVVDPYENANTGEQSIVSPLVLIGILALSYFVVYGKKRKK